MRGTAVDTPRLPALRAHLPRLGLAIWMSLFFLEAVSGRTKCRALALVSATKTSPWALHSCKIKTWKVSLFLLLSLSLFLRSKDEPPNS